MHIIKVNAIDSTNTFAREYYREHSLENPVCICTKQQTKGRGQRGTEWISKPGQNLTFSLIYPNPSISASQQFLLSASVANALVKVLKNFQIPKLKLKWPNDIMSAKHKLGGILIENIVSEGFLTASIIGIGINVNQTEFEQLPTASSLKLVSGLHFDLQEVLQKILFQLETDLNELNSGKAEAILEEYQQHLFRKGVPSTFQLPDHSMFIGIIESVSPTGKLQVRTEEETLREFDLKEVKLCF